MDDADLAILLNDLRMTGSQRQRGAIEKIKFTGQATKIEEKGIANPDPNAATRAAAAAALMKENRREDLPLLHMLLREEARCCKEQWGASELLTNLGRALSKHAEPASLLSIMEAMSFGFDCYCALGDQEILKPFNTEKCRAYLQQTRAQAPNERVKKLAGEALKYLDETFSE